MRRRKPWVFARRRVLGWNVRLLTAGSPYEGRVSIRMDGSGELMENRLAVGGGPLTDDPAGTDRPSAENVLAHGLDGEDQAASCRSTATVPRYGPSSLGSNAAGEVLPEPPLWRNRRFSHDPITF